MADTKITALAAITTVDPAADVLPIVDVSDTSMAASGTTKKITSNQILGAGGTATLASATITGDLTVDTSTLKVDSANNRVGIGTASPITGSSLDVRGAVGTGTDIQSLTVIDTSALAANNGGGISFGYVFLSPSTVIGRAGYIKTIKENATDGNYASAMVFGVTANGASTAERYRIGSDGVATWSNVGGVAGTAMTLNSTGLGVGGSPASGIKLNVHQGGSTSAYLKISNGDTGSGTGDGLDIIVNNAAGNYKTNFLLRETGAMAFWTDSTERLLIDATGNVGVGVTPSANWDTATPAVQVKGRLSLSGYVGNSWLSHNAVNAAAGWQYLATAAASQIALVDNTILFRNAASGTAGNALTWTQAMTLDASGRLFVGATSITAGYTGNNYFIVGGVTSPTIKLQSTTGPAAWDIYSAGGADLFVAYNASDKGQFNSSTGVYTALSDANKKKDFEPSNIGLAEVLKLKPTLFRMIGAADDSSKELGFVAQDVQSVIPQAYVETESQGGKFIGLQDRPIIAALTRAIQELTARVAALEA